MSPVVKAPATTAAKPAATPKQAKGPKPVAVGGKKGVPGAAKIVDKELPSFSRQLSAMLSAGMPIVASLEALEEQTDTPAFKAVISRVRKSIENGAAFSESLRQFPTIFDDLYSNMVKGGETGGQLAETIGRLSGFLEASANLKRKVKSAMMYPIIVLSIACVIAIGMILFIVPVFGDMFADFGANLPGPTQALLDFSDFLKANGFYLLIGITAVVVGFKKWKATTKGTIALDRMALNLPVFGVLNKKVAASRFARTFGQLTRSGVPILSALEITAGATGNVVAGKVILDSREFVEKVSLYPMQWSTRPFSQTCWCVCFRPAKKQVK